MLTENRLIICVLKVVLETIISNIHKCTCKICSDCHFKCHNYSLDTHLLKSLLL